VDLEPSGSPSMVSRSLEFSSAWNDRLKVADEAVRKLQEEKKRRGSVPGSRSAGTQERPSRRQLRPKQNQRTPRPRSRLRTKAAKPFSEQAELALRRVVNELRRTKSPVSSLMREGDTDGSGDLTADGIVAVLERRAPRVKLDPSEAGAIVAALDGDGDGHITSRDFIVGIQQVRSRMGLLAKAGSPNGSESRPVGGAHGGIREDSTPVLSLSCCSSPVGSTSTPNGHTTVAAATTPGGPLLWHELSRGSPNSSYRRRTAHCECTESPRARSARNSSMHKVPRDQRPVGLHENSGRSAGSTGSRCSSSSSTGSRVTSECRGTSSQDSFRSTMSNGQSRLAGPNVQELAATRIAKHVRGYLVRFQIQEELAYVLREHVTSPSPADRDGALDNNSEPQDCGWWR
jgi:hypothetical protein